MKTILICATDGCDRPAYARSVCDPCYQRAWRRGQHSDLPRAIGQAPPGGLCSVDGCERRHYGRGWCKGHYGRWARCGDVRADVPLRPHRERFGQYNRGRSKPLVPRTFDLDDTGEL